MRQEIVGLFPDRDKYDTFVDAYGGMGWVLLAHDPTGKSEVYNDKNRALSTMFKVLADPKLFDGLEGFYRRVAVLPFSELVFNEAKNTLDKWQRGKLKLTDVEVAYNFYVLCRQSRTGNCKDFATPTKNRLRRGMNEQVSAWLTSLDDLPRIARRLQRVMICNQPAIEVIEKYDTKRTVFYLDPPYHPGTRTDIKAYGEYDMTEDQHEELLKFLVSKDRKGFILISGRDNPLYAKYLAAWTRYELGEKVNNMSNKKVKNRVAEYVWMNY